MIKRANGRKKEGKRLQLSMSHFFSRLPCLSCFSIRWELLRGTRRMVAWVGPILALGAVTSSADPRVGAHMEARVEAPVEAPVEAMLGAPEAVKVFQEPQSQAVPDDETPADPLPDAQAPAGEVPSGQVPLNQAAEAPEEPSAPLTDEERTLLLRAGSGRIAGLSAARRSARDTERSAAVGQLEDLLGPQTERRALLQAELERLLSDPADQASWCVGARAAGLLGVYELAPNLASELGQSDSPRRRLAAREGLRDLFGRWFSQPDEVQPFLSEVQPGAGTELLVQSALAADNLAVDRELGRLKLLAQDPGRLLDDGGQLNEARFAEVRQLMGADDPRYRRGAAQLVAAVARESEDAAVRASLWQDLLQRMGTEADPLVFEGLVGLLVDEFSARALSEDQLESLRSQLLTLAGTVEPRRALAVAEGLARLPWIPTAQPATPEADPDTPSEQPEQGSEVGSSAKLGAALSTFGQLLQRLIDGMNQGGVIESEILLGTISSAELLLSNVEPDVLLQEEGVADLRAPLLGILRRSSSAAVGMRIAALGPYTRIARGVDIAPLLRQIDAEQTPPTYVYALLGALGPRYFQNPDNATGSGGTGSGLIFVAHVASLLEKTKDADLQKRALRMLADDRLATLLDGTFGPSSQSDPKGSQGFDPSLDSQLLGADASQRLANSLMTMLASASTQPEQRSVATRLFGRVAGPELLVPFLNLPTFDQMASAGQKELGEMTDMLQQVAAGDPTSLFALARRLVAVQDKKTTIFRMRSALGLVAEFDADTAAQFSPAQDSDVCRWALDLRAAGLPLDELVPQGKALRDRLLAVHVPGAEEGGTLEPWRLSHLRALLLASRVLEGAVGALAADVDKAYEAALASAKNGERALVLRDRARWRMGRDTPKRALADYTQLRQSDVLQVSDIRAALSALDLDAPPAGEPRNTYLSERVQWLRSLVERKNWSVEATAVRLEDLTAYVDGVLALPQPLRAQFLPQLTEFFSTLPSPDTTPETPPQRWQSFLADPEALGRLRELQVRVKGASAPQPNPAPGTEKGPDDSAPQPSPPDEAGSESEEADKGTGEGSGGNSGGA